MYICIYIYIYAHVHTYQSGWQRKIGQTHGETTYFLHVFCFGGLGSGLGVGGRMVEDCQVYGPGQYALEPRFVFYICITCSKQAWVNCGT